LNIKEDIKKVKKASLSLQGKSLESRNKALFAVIEVLKLNQDKIIKANKEDMEIAKENKIETAILGRLKFDEKKLNDVITGINDLINLPDPLFHTQLARELDEDLKLYKETCPIGVIGVIFEARPDALIQISTLCLKSGNCIILKGGSEAARTNKILFEVIYQAVLKADMPNDCMMLLEARNEIKELLTCHESVDLLIPRGSNSFVQYIMDNTKIPVMGHADGICHIYVDKNADVDKAIPIIVDAKTQYVSACNTVETLLIHKNMVSAIIPNLKKALDENKVEVRATKDICEMIDCFEASEDDFNTEYLDYILSIKTVESLEDAIEHVNHYGSHHTDCIITEDAKATNVFMKMVDSANVYQNCSTRFADGYRYGFGAEVGISTAKLHARGPVGLEGLVSYKYKIFGNGQIVEDYSNGSKKFHFKDIPM
jgi:glutamate-5-semialdehyde dehydrogenase